MGWKKHLALVFILFLGLLFRFYLSTKSFHVDLLIQAGWGQYVGSIGPIDMYENNVWVFSWPNHPPLISLLYGLSYRLYVYLYYFLPRTSLYLINHPLLPSSFTLNYTSFVNSFITTVSPEKPFPLGFLLCLKLWPILADLCLGVLIYTIVSKHSKHALLFLILYIFSPFSIFLSAAWGQTDQLSFLPVLLAFLALGPIPILTIPLFWLGLSLKPTALLLLPSLALLWQKYHPPFKYLFIGIIFCFLFTYLYTDPFTNRSPLPYLVHEIVPKVFNRGGGRLTTNSFNFWHSLTHGQPVSDSIIYFLLPSKYFAYLFLVIIHIYAWLKTRKQKDLSSIITFLFTISAGIWMFSSNMLDRYFFPGLIFGLLVCTRKPKLLFLWLPMSFIFLLNLARGYWNEYSNILESTLPLLNTFLYLIMAILA